MRCISLYLEVCARRRREVQTHERCKTVVATSAGCRALRGLEVRTNLCVHMRIIRHVLAHSECKMEQTYFRQE